MRASGSSVEELARTRDYEDFIGAFGTHYPYAVTFGGRGILQMEMDKTTYNKLVGQDVSIQNNVNAQIKMVSGGAGFAEGESVSSSFKEGDELPARQLPVDRRNGGLRQGGWNVTDRVAPIYLDLRPIDELLAPPFFRDSTIITEVRRDLREAVLAYLAAAPKPEGRRRRRSAGPPPALRGRGGAHPRRFDSRGSRSQGGALGLDRGARLRPRRSERADGGRLAQHLARRRGQAHGGAGPGSFTTWPVPERAGGAGSTRSRPRPCAVGATPRSGQSCASTTGTRC